MHERTEIVEQCRNFFPACSVKRCSRNSYVVTIILGKGYTILGDPEQCGFVALRWQLYPARTLLNHLESGVSVALRFSRVALLPIRTAGTREDALHSYDFNIHCRD